MTTTVQDFKVADLSLASFGRKEIELAEPVMRQPARGLESP